MSGRAPRRFAALAALALVLALGGAACSLDKAGVVREPYRQVVVPKVFDQVMDARSGDGVLRAGVKVVDVTPYDREAWIAGFGQMRKSHGVLDPVTARILYLDDGREAVVLIALDLVGMVRADVNRLRSLITANHPHRITVISTHNHEGPDPVGFWGPGLFAPVQRGVDEDWFAKTLQATAQGVNDAIAAAQPVQIATGVTEVDDEWSTNMWFEHGAGPIDRRMNVLRLETLDGRALATVANWACHAETLLAGPKISADFPGRFYKYCEQTGGGVGIFYNGALGGMISPRIARFDLRATYKDYDGRVAWMDRLGERLAVLANQAVADVPRQTDARLARKWGEVTIPVRNGLFVTMFRTGVLGAEAQALRGHSLISEVSWLKVGDAQFAFVPGEAFPDLGKKLKAAMPFAKAPFVVGLANDELAYMMMPDQWLDSTYSYEKTMSTGRYTGQRVFDAFIDLLAD